MECHELTPLPYADRWLVRRAATYSIQFPFSRPQSRKLEQRPGCSRITHAHSDQLLLGAKHPLDHEYLMYTCIIVYSLPTTPNLILTCYTIIEKGDEMHVRWHDASQCDGRFGRESRWCRGTLFAGKTMPARFDFRW